MSSRPWSKYTKGSSAYQRKHPEEAKAAGGEKKAMTKNPSQDTEEDEEKKKEDEEKRKKKGGSGASCLDLAQELQEFLNVMKSGRTKKTWRNDEAVVASVS